MQSLAERIGGMRERFYLVDVQGLHGVLHKLDVDLSLFGLQLLVGNELRICKNRMRGEDYVMCT